jgi:hypothetical protein
LFGITINSKLRFEQHQPHWNQNTPEWLAVLVLIWAPLVLLSDDANIWHLRIHFAFHCIYEWRQSSYKKRELLILRENLSSPRYFGGVRVAHLFSFLRCPILCLYILSSVLWYPLRFRHKTMFGSTFPPVVAGEVMSYLRHLCLCAYGGVENIYWIYE